MNVEELSGRVLIDTNVLIYAPLRGDFRHEAARAVLDLRHREGVELYVSVQNLAEMYPNLTGPKNNPPDSSEVARAKIDSIASLDRLTVLPLHASITRKALHLCAFHFISRQRYFDMQLVASMVDAGIEVLLTENVIDFDSIKGIRAISPFS